MAARTGRGNTPIRTIRICDDLWDASEERASELGTTVSAVIRGYLREFTGKKGSDAQRRP